MIARAFAFVPFVVIVLCAACVGHGASALAWSAPPLMRSGVWRKVVSEDAGAAFFVVLDDSTVVVAAREGESICYEGTLVPTTRWSAHGWHRSPLIRSDDGTLSISLVGGREVFGRLIDEDLFEMAPGMELYRWVDQRVTPLSDVEISTAALRPEITEPVAAETEGCISEVLGASQEALEAVLRRQPLRGGSAPEDAGTGGR